MTKHENTKEQMKVGGVVRRLWTEAERAIVKQKWHTHQPIEQWADLLPGRTFHGISRIAKVMGLGDRPGKPRLAYAYCWNCICAVLADKKPRTIAELAEATGFTKSEVRKHISARIGEETYVAEWRIVGSHHVAVFMLGARKANAKPPELTRRQQTNRNYYLRMKHFEPAKYEAMLRKKEADRKAAKIDARPKQTDSAASWLFNPVSPC